jgi:hypothetical protein
MCHLAAHLEPPTERRKGLLVVHNCIHKSYPLFHGTGFFETIGKVCPADQLNL